MELRQVLSRSIVVDQNDRVVGFLDTSKAGGRVQFFATVVVDETGAFVDLLGPDGQSIPIGGGEGGVSNGDKGDIVVTGGGITWTIDNDAVTNAKAANMANGTIKARISSGAGDPEDATASQIKTLLAIAIVDVSGLQSALDAKAATSHAHAISGVTGLQTALNDLDSDISSLASATTTSLAGKQATLVSASNIKTINGISLLGAGDIDVSGGGGTPTNLSYTAATRVLASSTGDDATLPLVSSSNAGLAPASGGGTSNFLRADGTWAAPPGGGGVSDGDKGDIVVSGSGAAWAIDAGAVTNTKVATGIDAAKLADGSVSNTEFQHLNGVTSGIQTQLDGKLGASDATEITDTKAVPVGADGLIVRDSAASDALKFTTRAGLDTTNVGTSLGTTGTVNLDLAALVGTEQEITATGNITFTTSNRAAGRNFELRIAAGGSTRTLAWPAGWVAFGAALPTSLASGKVLRLAIFCRGTTDASIDVAAAESA